MVYKCKKAAVLAAFLSCQRSFDVTPKPFFGLFLVDGAAAAAFGVSENLSLPLKATSQCRIGKAAKKIVGFLPREICHSLNPG